MNLKKSCTINCNFFSRQSFVESLISPKKSKLFNTSDTFKQFKKKTLSFILDNYVQKVKLNQKQILNKINSVIFLKLNEHFETKIKFYLKYRNHVKELEFLKNDESGN